MISSPNLLPVTILVERSRRRRMARWAGLVALEAVVLTAACVFARASNKDEVSVPKEAIESTVSQIDLLSTALAEARAELEVIERRIAVVKTVTMRPEWSVVMSFVANEGQGLVTLESCQLMPGAALAEGKGVVYRFTFLGTAGSQENATRFGRSLKESGLFDTAQLVETRRIGTAEQPDSVRFTIEASLVEGGPA